jgi:DNA-binding CsgD family transcriptional regulator
MIKPSLLSSASKVSTSHLHPPQRAQQVAVRQNLVVNRAASLARDSGRQLRPASAERDDPESGENGEAQPEAGVARGDFTIYFLLAHRAANVLADLSELPGPFRGVGLPAKDLRDARHLSPINGHRLVLQALALQAQHERTAAVQAVERALVLAEPESYVRVFVDEGAPMAGLLQDLFQTRRNMFHDQKHAGLLRYARRLITEFHPPDLGDVNDALTGREREVLELIAGGLSNRDIAARLYVATSTVKSYTNSIFRRLGVTSWTQAVAKARALHLLAD